MWNLINIVEADSTPKRVIQLPSLLSQSRKVLLVFSFDDGRQGGGWGGWSRGIRGKNDAFLLDPVDHLDHSDLRQAEDPRW